VFPLIPLDSNLVSYFKPKLRWWQREISISKILFSRSLHLFSPFFFVLDQLECVDLLDFSLTTPRVKLLNQHKLRIHQGVKHIFTLVTLTVGWDRGKSAAERARKKKIHVEAVKCTTKYGLIGLIESCHMTMYKREKDRSISLCWNSRQEWHA
jgi:hypothetical protein